MLITILVMVEILVFAASFFDVGRMRLVTGRDFSTTRKLLAAQAIIALILIVFFQLVGTAGGEQRDGARKIIAGRLGSAIQNYVSNSSSSSAGFTCTSGSYCNGITDPDTTTQPVPGTVATSSSGVMYALGHNCAGNLSSTGYAIYYWEEQGGGHSQCLDSN